MYNISKLILVGIIIIIAFIIAGNIGELVESYHDNMLVGAGIFSFSFLSIIGGILNFWQKVFS